MKSIYFENDDILQIRASDKAIVREVSQDWYTSISYAEDDTIVEIVLLDVKEFGLLPLVYRSSAWITAALNISNNAKVKPLRNVANSNTSLR